jgi:hypothetical protein
MGLWGGGGIDTRRQVGSQQDYSRIFIRWGCSASPMLLVLLEHGPEGANKAHEVTPVRLTLQQHQ